MGLARQKNYVWPSCIRVAKFWERYAKYAEDITSTHEDEQKIKQLDDLADEINPLLNVEPRNLSRLVETALAAYKICDAHPPVIKGLRQLCPNLE